MRCARLVAAAVALLVAATTASADTNETFIDHGRYAPFWFGAELNAIFQAHPTFAAPYSGTNSLRAGGESATSALFTVYFAYQPHRTTEIILDAEMAFGGGLSSALGVAGFTNLDVVRNPTLSSEPYVARLEIHQMIPLSRDWEPNADRGPLSTFARVPRHRLELRLGKMSTADVFDVNPAGSDSHLQFMNWTVDNNGAYDYAADTRGYTYGLVVAYEGPLLAVRFAEMLMPKVANGIDIDFDVTRSHSEQLEVQLDYLRRRHWAGTLRVLGYENFANMGSYAEAIAAFTDGSDVQPDITLHRHARNTKFGFGLNAMQELGGVVRAFARGGWNDGRHESYAYTEVDDTFELGFDVAGAWWRRPIDKIGLAVVTNGISALHQQYLRLGGHEDIVELYYNAHVWRGAYAAGDVQLVDHPGYNQDRGPAWVLSLRGHLEF
jgi:hypothetical protein